MEILDEKSNNDAIDWLPHGRGFIVLRKKEFEENILPKYFHKQSKYSSFTRKLNRWGFTRVTRGPEAGAYYNQHFRRGGHRQVMQMSCQSNSKRPVLSKALPLAAPTLATPTQLALAQNQHSIAEQLALHQVAQLRLQQQLLVRRAVLGGSALGGGTLGGGTLGGIADSPLLQQLLLNQSGGLPDLSSSLSQLLGHPNDPKLGPF